MVNITDIKISYSIHSLIILSDKKLDIFFEKFSNNNFL